MESGIDRISLLLCYDPFMLPLPTRLIRFKIGLASAHQNGEMGRLLRSYLGHLKLQYCQARTLEKLENDMLVIGTRDGKLDIVSHQNGIVLNRVRLIATRASLSIPGRSSPVALTASSISIRRVSTGPSRNRFEKLLSPWNQPSAVALIYRREFQPPHGNLVLGGWSICI